MKKLIALCLALALLYAVPASAAQWAEGCSPAQPYPDVPPQDLSKTIGYMLFYPSNGMDVVGGCRMLRIILPRTDVKAGHGSVKLTCVEDGTTWTAVFNDTDYVSQRDMDEDELNYVIWGSGTCFEIMLPVSLSQNCNYTVEMDADCIISTDNAVSNPVRGADKWHFSTESDYGIWDMEYVRANAKGGYDVAIRNPVEGDEIHLTVALGGEAVQAVLKSLADVEFDEVVITQSGEVTGHVTGPNASWRAIFYDANGQVIDAVET